MTATHSCELCSMKETCQNEELNIRAIVPRNRFLAMEMNGDWDTIDKREKLLNDFEEVIRREERSRHEKEPCSMCKAIHRRMNKELRYHNRPYDYALELFEKIYHEEEKRIFGGEKK